MLTSVQMTQISTRIACVFGLLVFPVVGCSDLSGEGSGGMGGIGGVGATGGSGASGGLSSGVKSLFVLLTDGNENRCASTPLEGGRICDVGTDVCVTTGPNGKAVLDLPANQVVTYTITKDGYVPRVFGDVTGDNFNPRPSCFFMFRSEDLANRIESEGGVWSPETSGFIWVNAVPFRAGVTHELVDQPDITKWYMGADGRFRVDLESTTAAGEGGFFNVPPGDHQIDFGGTATNCRPLRAWPGDTPSRIKIPVMAGYKSYGAADCDWR